ncbi:MAG: sigma-70 family RNA polymerase sigma factor [Candidatus Microthrix parvicella]|jgi:hypothetical protein|uniref:RNA polymerase sigma factor 70 region 4 type 2 domain-containing protein n=1 Tax=Candidatus Neomicrothrix parvicella RN1 TaxID=1229780 RepID=R4Z1Q3_9ACTN|nr:MULTISPECIES: hypothetical protein [Microthrix]MBK7323148.1 sigma-70 family RNA polymerase sigma factor [Candidatus Microthrix sp.]MBP9835073.1 sigma-70 family RNA polymerase sigma factor [Candidatus Microthrix sp.]NMD18725.1 sigma-70 family RNA polymerase sigma factor [Verrucomicrobiota bacterium]CCM63201.1 conserved hypothetical protein [Candidatus Microthrix parvicella RN1]
MAHTDEEIDAASRRFEQLVNDFDPAAAVVDNIDELSQVAAASEAVRAGEAKLRESVEIARAHGRSWNEIALALGVTRQAARQRFSDRASA